MNKRIILKTLDAFVNDSRLWKKSVKDKLYFWIGAELINFNNLKDE